MEVPRQGKIRVDDVVNSMVRSIDVLDDSALPNLRRGSMILVGSDYSGQHATSIYESLAFILADIQQYRGWEESRREIRAQILGDDRRLSYKTLKDKRRADALYDFLYAADDIPGLLVVILTRKSIESLFKISGLCRSCKLTHPYSEEVTRW